MPLRHILLDVRNIGIVNVKNEKKQKNRLKKQKYFFF